MTSRAPSCVFEGGPGAAGLKNGTRSAGGGCKSKGVTPAGRLYSVRPAAVSRLLPPAPACSRLLPLLVAPWALRWLLLLPRLPTAGASFRLEGLIGRRPAARPPPLPGSVRLLPMGRPLVEPTARPSSRLAALTTLDCGSCGPRAPLPTCAITPVSLVHRRTPGSAWRRRGAELPRGAPGCQRPVCSGSIIARIAGIARITAVVN